MIWNGKELTSDDVFNYKDTAIDYSVKHENGPYNNNHDNCVYHSIKKNNNDLTSLIETAINNYGEDVLHVICLAITISKCIILKEKEYANTDNKFIRNKPSISNTGQVLTKNTAKRKYKRRQS